MLAFALWNKSSRTSPTRWLTVIAFIICYKLFEGGALYTGLYTYVAHIMDFIPYMVLWIGPMLWMYVRQVSGKPPLPPALLIANFIPALAIWCLNAPSVFQHMDAKIMMWSSALNTSSSELPVIAIALLLSIKVHLGIYLFASWRVISRFKAAASKLRADNSTFILANMQFMVAAFFLLELLWVGLFAAQQTMGLLTLNAVSDIWLLFVGFMVLAIGYIGLQQPGLVFTPEECKLAEQQIQPDASDTRGDTNVKYLHSALPDSTSEVLSQELEKQIKQQQLYLKDKLTLTDLAKATGIKAHTLSQVINQAMKTNFYKLINGYRVQHALELIEEPNQSWSLERIALESGFSNRVTFNKAFKEVMECTPSAYKKKIAQAS